MKGAALVMQRLSRLSFSLLTSAERTKVLSRDWNLVGKELHDDTTNLLASHLNIKKDTRIIWMRNVLNGNFWNKYRLATIQASESSKHEKEHETEHGLEIKRQ